MSGKVPKRVSSERTAGSREGTRMVNGVKMNEGAVLLGLVGSVGHSKSTWNTLKKKSFTSELQVDSKMSQSNGGFMNLHTMLDNINQSQAGVDFEHTESTIVSGGTDILAFASLAGEKVSN